MNPQRPRGLPEPRCGDNSLARFRGGRGAATRPGYPTGPAGAGSSLVCLARWFRLERSAGTLAQLLREGNKGAHNSSGLGATRCHRYRGGRNVLQQAAAATATSAVAG